MEYVAGIIMEEPKNYQVYCVHTLYIASFPGTPAGGGGKTWIREISDKFRLYTLNITG